MSRFHKGFAQACPEFDGMDPPFTMACFYRPRSLTSTHVLMSLQLSSAIGVDYTHTLHVDSSNRVGATSRTTTDATSLIQGRNLAGGWQHAGAVFSSSSNRVAYWNGIAATANLTSKAINPVVQLNIGAAGLSGAPFSGLTAFPALWKAALSGSEMLALASGVPPDQIRRESLFRYYPPWLEGYYDLCAVTQTLLGPGTATVDADRPQLLTRPYPIWAPYRAPPAPKPPMSYYRLGLLSR